MNFYCVLINQDLSFKYRNLSQLNPMIHKLQNSRKIRKCPKAKSMIVSYNSRPFVWIIAVCLPFESFSLKFNVINYWNVLQTLIFFPISMLTTEVNKYGPSYFKRCLYPKML